jgi:outer membrane lipoprotein SlyB
VLKHNLPGSESRKKRTSRRDKMSRKFVLGTIAGLSLLTMVTTACGTLAGAAIGAGSGAAIGAAHGDAKKGALIGAGVGAAAGAIYDATRGL